MPISDYDAWVQEKKIKSLKKMAVYGTLAGLGWGFILGGMFSDNKTDCSNGNSSPKMSFTKDSTLIIK